MCRQVRFIITIFFLIFTDTIYAVSLKEMIVRC
ncbi:putative membrane protein [Francisella tularensis]|nr:putative membrane protein [Francisella tularensis]